MKRRLLLLVAVAFPLRAWAADGTGPADSSGVSADSSGAAADSIPAPPEPPFRVHPAAAELASFRLERSVDVETVSFGSPEDPIVPPGVQTLADVLRLSPEVRTRELSQGPTTESWELRGLGSGRAGVLLDARSTLVPGTSGPHTHEVMLSEISGGRILRGGAAALYGPDAVAGALVLDPSHPLPDELTSRAFAEEGVDGYQRAGFQAAQRLGSAAGLFLTTESRRVDGFFPGTKEIDRHFAGRVVGRLPWGLEGRAGYRRFEGDGRFGGFDPSSIGSVLTKRSDWHATLFRPFGEGRGTLLDAAWRRERLENVTNAGVSERVTSSPLLRLTTDLPSRLGWQGTVRLEGSRWRVERKQAATSRNSWQGAAAVRVTRPFGPGGFFTGTFRVDGAENRRRGIQLRTEAQGGLGMLRVFGVASHNERPPELGADASPNEVTRSAEAGLRLRQGAVEVRVVGFGSLVDDYRPEPTFEQIRAREEPPAAPVGDAEIWGGTAGVETERFPVPGLPGVGDLRLRTSYTWLSAEDRNTARKLPRRARRTWTGESLLERRFFAGELLARVRGRLTHWGDRVNEAGESVVNLWLTDVLLEGEVGDAVFFYRFHDMLERADEVEPGIRFPGFSRMYGISWRFRG